MMNNLNKNNLDKLTTSNFGRNPGSWGISEYDIYQICMVRLGNPNYDDPQSSDPGNIFPNFTPINSDGSYCNPFQNNGKFGNIDDLDPKLYNSSFMNIVSWGRGTSKYSGNIDNLDPRLYDHNQADLISRGRGIDPEYGNIDDLDPKFYDKDQMGVVALGRGNNKEYGNIDKLDPKNRDAYQMKELSKKIARMIDGI